VSVEVPEEASGGQSEANVESVLVEDAGEEQSDVNVDALRVGEPGVSGGTVEAQGRGSGLRSRDRGLG